MQLYIKVVDKIGVIILEGSRGLVFLNIVDDVIEKMYIR